MTTPSVRVLLFTRPYLIPDYKACLSLLPARFDVHYLTDSAGAGVPDTTRVFYESLAADRRSPEVDIALEDEVIPRCRLLRNLPRQRAAQLVHAMALALAEHLDAVRPQVVITQLIDEYVIHLFTILAERRGAACAQYGPSYFQDKMLITRSAYGIARPVRVADKEEAVAILDRIKDVRYRQNYTLTVDYSVFRHCWQVARYGVKKAVFWLHGRWKGDPLYVHYAILPYIAERKSILDYPRARSFDADWEQKVASRRAGGKLTAVYLPLSYSPEATIDYWIADRRMIDYEARTLDMLRALGADGEILVLLKDHTHMMGMRSRKFYAAVNAMPNVVNVPPSEFGNKVMSSVDAVLLGAGSTGVEAMVHDKPVVTVCNTSYWYGPTGAYFLSLDKISEWAARIKETVGGFRKKSDEEKRQAILRMLESTIPTKSPGKVWPVADPVHLERMIETMLVRPASAPNPAKNAVEP